MLRFKDVKTKLSVCTDIYVNFEYKCKVGTIIAQDNRVFDSYYVWYIGLLQDNYLIVDLKKPEKES